VSEDIGSDDPAPIHEYDRLDDHALLAGGVHYLVAENSAAASRLLRMLVFYERRCAVVDPSAVPGRRALTAVQETVIEVGELWGLSPGRVRSDLLHCRVLTTSFPDVWRLCRLGALDGYRAGLVAEAATNLPERSWPAFAERIGHWLRKHLRRPGGDPELPELVCCTVKQLRNKLTYEVNKLARGKPTNGSGAPSPIAARPHGPGRSTARSTTAWAACPSRTPSIRCRSPTTG
jgi:hypothetical protein